MGCSHGSEESSGLSRSMDVRTLGRRLGASNVMVFDLCNNETFDALRTVSTEADWSQHVLPSQGFEDLGPAIAGIMAHVEGGEFGTNFQFKVVLQYKWRNGAWQDAGTLVAATGSETYVAATEFTDRTKFGMKLRVVLRTSLEAGTAPERGSVSVSLAVRLICT